MTSSNQDKMAIGDYSDQTIAEVIIIGGMAFCVLSVSCQQTEHSVFIQNPS